MLRGTAKRLLLTQSGHSKIVRFIGGVMTVTPNFVYFVLIEDRGKGFVDSNPWFLVWEGTSFAKTYE